MELLGALLGLVSMLAFLVGLAGVITPRLSWLDSRKAVALKVLLPSFVLYIVAMIILPTPEVAPEEQSTEQVAEATEKPEPQIAEPAPGGKAEKPTPEESESKPEESAPQVATDTDQKKEPQPAFGFSVEEFVERVNKALSSLDQHHLRASIKKMSQTDNGDWVAQAFINENLGFVLTGNEDKNLRYAQFMGTGDGTPKSGLDIMLCLAAMPMAIEGQYKADDISGSLQALGFANADFSQEFEKTSTVNGVQYKLQKSDMLGIWFSATPSKDGEVKEKEAVKKESDSSSEVVNKGGIPADVMAAIKAQASADWADDFTMQLSVIENQKKAYTELYLNSFQPDGVPDDVLQKIIKAAQSDWVNDYIMQQSVIIDQIEAYRKLQ